VQINDRRLRSGTGKEKEILNRLLQQDESAHYYMEEGGKSKWYGGKHRRERQG